VAVVVKPALEADRRFLPGAGEEKFDAVRDGASNERGRRASAVLPEAAFQVDGESDVVPGVPVRAAEVQEIDGADDQPALAR
jgi:hypothetical protein